MQGDHSKSSLVRILEGVLPESVLLRIVDKAQELADSPNYWMTKEAISKGRPYQSPAEEAIHQIHTHFNKLLPDDFAGAEYWVQMYQPGKGLDFHFDKDEILMKEKGEMRHPCISSILYLTGSSDSPPLGPTVIISQHFDNNSKSAQPEQPEHCAFIWPQRGTLAIFDGALGHGVLDSAAEGERITMLINWWKYQPAAVFESPKSTPAATAVASSRVKEGPLARRELDIGSPREQEVPSITVPESSEPQALTVDDLLQSCGLPITGEKAISALNVFHQGYELYPVPSDQSDQFHSLNTAAAFVSSELLRADSDSE